MDNNRGGRGGGRGGGNARGGGGGGRGGGRGGYSAPGSAGGGQRQGPPGFQQQPQQPRSGPVQAWGGATSGGSGGGGGGGGVPRGGGSVGAGQVQQRPSPPASASVSVQQQPQQQQQQRLSQPPRAFVPQPQMPPFELDAEIVALERVRPTRPNPGVKGKRIRLFANSFPMSIPDSDCFHYDVEIKPDTVPAVNRRIFEQWKKVVAAKEAKDAVYDGRKNLYTPKKMPIPEEGNEMTVVISGEDKKEQKFNFRVRLVAVINMERLHRFIQNKGDNEIPREAMTVLDLILASRPNALFTAINKKTGSSFYKAYNPQFNISGGLNLHQGWKQSVKITYKEVLLNLDVACTAFYRPGPLLDVVAGFFNRGRIQDINPRQLAPGTVEFQRLSKFLSNVNVEITYRDSGRRKYKIRALSKQTPDKAMIVITDTKTKMTVADYFLKEFKIRIQYPFLPLVMCGNDGQILLPMELLIVKEGQRHLGKLSDVQTADVIKIAAVAPPERQGRIMEGRKSLHDAPGGDSLMKAWGVNLQPQMKQIEGRILPQPVVTGSAEVRPQNGAYDLSKVGNVKFFRPAKLEFWSVAVFGDTRNMQFDAVAEFLGRLFTECMNRGMYVSKRDFKDVIVAQQRRGVEETLLEANRKAIEASQKVLPPGSKMPACAQMIFCIFDKGGVTYDEIKLFSETKHNLMTQCFLSKHLPPKGPKPGVTTNLALKVNAKLGGVNMVVDPATQLNVLGAPVPTMVMGADVTHPPAGANGGVSIASLVASMDAKFAEYRAAIRVQGPRIEIIQDLKSMAAEHLNQFQLRARGRYPDRLIFFRDGVSEGQFGEVALQEVQNLKIALREVGAGHCKLTFLVVNKRHAHRFFVADQKDGDRKGNLMAGTVIDTGITHPFEFDFFLNSHQGLQGTSRAAHYHVLYDENKFSSDDLQEITYRMCYLFARASRSVGIVPAVYYAHLVAYRARCYRPGGVGGSSEMGGSSTGGIDSAAIDEFEKVTDEMLKTMFFT